MVEPPVGLKNEKEEGGNHNNLATDSAATLDLLSGWLMNGGNYYNIDKDFATNLDPLSGWYLGRLKIYLQTF